MADEKDIKVDTQEGIKKEEPKVVEAEVVEEKTSEANDIKEDVSEAKSETKEESIAAVAEPVKGKDGKEELPVELEREYIIPLKKGSLKVPRYKRAKKAVKTLKEFLAKHMHVEDRDLRKVKVDIYLNNEIWYRGIKKPTNKIKVKAVKRGGIVYAELSNMPEIVAFAKARLERRANKVTASQVKPKHGHAHDHGDKKNADKDGDGVADSKEEKEDKKAGEEKAAMDAKDSAKSEKHTAKAKTGKEEKQSVHRKAMKR